MFIAHLPAGYLVSHLHPRLARHRAAFMLGAVLPDVDILWWALADSSIHHHMFLTHRPVLWITLLAAGLIWHPLAILGLGALLHLCLDSFLGQIAWGWPISQQASPLITVPARFDWWPLSFLIHWTFLAEIVLCAAAAWLWHCKRTTQELPAHLPKTPGANRNKSAQ